MKQLQSVINISGKFTTGKTTLALALSRLDPRYNVVSLADALKDDVAGLCGVTREHLDASKETFRGLLQEYGTSVMRRIYGEDIWVERLIERCTNLGYTHIIVPDVRFPNELRYLTLCAEHAFNIRLVLSHDKLVERYTKVYGAPPTEAQLTHPSETAMDGYLWTGAFDTHIVTACAPEDTLRVALMAMECGDFDFMTQETHNVSAA